MVYEIKQSRPAPQNLNGTLYWLKENLFATIFDTILTLSVILFLWWVVPMFLDWAVFNASFSGTTKADATGWEQIGYLSKKNLICLYMVFIHKSKFIE